MPLPAGTRLHTYEIVAPLGEGGMGEVYRARDTKLNRDVAIKVLPELVADDPERRARFEREAQVLAALNHPHIAHIYGVEETGPAQTPTVALVMELVEGPTLADVVAARGRLPLDEAIRIGQQVADALEEHAGRVRTYDTTDGQRFLVVRTIEPYEQGIAVVQNWFEEFRRR